MKDFFISYNKADRSWAEWIAWTLEEAGYTVLIQHWDFRPGGNFVLEMQKAASDTRKTIAVLSENYLNAMFTQSEWSAAFTLDPQGQQRRLIPVRVDSCKPEGILTPIIYVDLVGLTEREAQTTLIEAMKERAKPTLTPSFPGGDQHSIPGRPNFPEDTPHEEVPLTKIPVGIKLFYSYAHEDESLRDQLEKHLSLLKRTGIITSWHDRKITPGTEWKTEISEYLDTAQIILLLVSADFLASDYCYDIEVARAMERHKARDARVIPVILRDCDWENAPFGDLQALPRDAKPVLSWANRDEAFASIAAGIRLACEEIQRTSLPLTTKTAQISYKLTDVFKPSGVPDITFVEPENFYLLKLALNQPGLGVVIEGPSGIGKTTALKKAMEQLELDEQLSEVKVLSARKPEDIEQIAGIRRWHNGVIAIDDYHRLDDRLRLLLVDYVKYLADYEVQEKKLVIVGIPGTGKRLVEIAFDVTTRIRTFKLGKVKDEIVLSMISKGESALNAVLDRKTDIVLAAGGSLNIAQILCSQLVARAGIDRTQSITKFVQCDLDAAISEVMELLSLKYAEVINYLATLDGHNNRTCIELLQELAYAENGFLSLPSLKVKRPDLSDGIDQFVSENFMSEVQRSFPVCENFLFYDERKHALIIDDPQLTFYLLKTPPSRLAQNAGKR